MLNSVAIQRVITGTTDLYGLVAHPAQHSLSPQLHNLGFQTLGLNAVYVAFDSQAAAAAIATSLRSLNIRGVNLSLPYKETLLPELDEVSATARLIGAVNTIKNDQGHLSGTNTDGEGFVAGLEAAGIDVATQTILLLGAGATARAILVALVAHGARQITVYQRPTSQHFAALQSLVQALGLPAAVVQPWPDLNQQTPPAGLSLLINATNLGFGANQQVSPVPAAWLQQLAVTCQVWDVIYAPRRTVLLQQAAARGLTVHNGVAMLFHQADLAFRFWTGQVLPTSAWSLLTQKK